MATTSDDNNKNRDQYHLGLAKPSQFSGDCLDVYGTLKEKLWESDLGSLLSLLDKSEIALRSVFSGDFVISRTAGMSPPVWSIGHIAYMYDFIVLNTLNIPCSYENSNFSRESAWEYYDSIRIPWDERFIICNNKFLTLISFIDGISSKQV
jgi:hypothetical protein